MDTDTWAAIETATKYAGIKTEQASSQEVPQEYDNAQIVREIDFSTFTEEELNASIDYLYEVLAEKRKESLLDQDPNLTHE